MKIKVDCPRCDGDGILPQYYYNRKGVCFLCWGSKKIMVKAKTEEEANKKREVMKAKEKAGLDAQPPSVAMPDNIKNPAFAKGKKVQPKTEGNIGKVSTASTERGTKIDTRYKVVEADDLVVSNTLAGTVNPAYPTELQPRDRSKTASKLQVMEIANNLDFNRLGESYLASSGSPIVGSDNVVESGNGRILAIQQAYFDGNASSEEYRRTLLKNASTFGLDAKALEGYKNPVLIRERTSDVDRVAFTREANESSVSTMSASEQAKNDAESLTNFIMEQYEGGDLRAIKNRPFVQAFMTNVVAASDRNKFLAEKVDRDGMKYGELSNEGEQRIKNAMFAKAYSDVGLLTKKAELDDTSNVKNVLNAMEENAVMYAKVKADIEGGYLHNHDLSENLIAAVKKADELRGQGENVMQYLNQPSFFGNELNDESRALLYFIEENKRNRTNIEDFMKAYVEELEALGNPNEADLFAGLDGLSNAYITQMQLIESAMKKVQPEVLPQLKKTIFNEW